MNVIVNAVLALVFGVLAYMGIDIPEDVRAAANDNVLAIASGVAGLLAAGKFTWDRIKAKRAENAPDEHADVGNQRGFAHKGMLVVIAQASAIALIAACATVQKDLPPDVRAAAVMRDAASVADSCAELYERQLIGGEEGMVCLFYVDQAIQAASAVHFLLATELPSPERDAEIAGILEQAEQIIAGLRNAIAEVEGKAKGTPVKREPEGWDGISSTEVYV